VLHNLFNLSPDRIKLIQKEMFSAASAPPKNDLDEFLPQFEAKSLSPEKK
jgi:hypothetical protein